MIINEDNNKLGLFGQYSGEVWVNVPAQGTKHLYTTESHSNLIVNVGRTWLTNLMAGLNTTPIQSIVVGTGSSQPALAQTISNMTPTVGHNTTNSILVSPNYGVQGSAQFSASEINGTTEVAIFAGLINGLTGSQSGLPAAGSLMLARNIHTAINLPLGSSITFNYVIGLNTAKNATGWTQTSNLTGTHSTTVFQITDPVSVVGVLEIDTYNGYTVQTRVADVQANPGSYWHDTVNGITYIQATDSANMAATTQPHTILIVSGAT